LLNFVLLARGCKSLVNKGNVIYIDLSEYYLKDVDKTLGILAIGIASGSENREKKKNYLFDKISNTN
jgi:hypothetical protein